MKLNKNLQRDGGGGPQEKTVPYGGGGYGFFLELYITGICVMRGEVEDIRTNREWDGRQISEGDYIL